MKQIFGLGDLELLALWRTEPARDLLRSDLSLMSAALQRSAFAHPELGKVLEEFDPRRAVGEAAAAYGFTLIQGVNECPRQPETPFLLDVGASFHLIAARDGFATSYMVLAQLLADGAFTDLFSRRTGGEARLAYDQLARGWVIRLLRHDGLCETLRLNNANDLDHLRGLCYRHREPTIDGITVIDRDRKDPQPESPAPDPASNLVGDPRDGTTVRVICERPNRQAIQASKDSERLRQQFDALFHPLPIGGTNMKADTVLSVLELEFPWMNEAIGAVRDQLRLNALSGRPGFRLRPLLLVGPPGAGKTRFARRLAYLAGTAVAEISGAGSSDNRMLQGTASGWSGAQPAFPVMAMARHRVANPVIILDEVDKASDNRRNGRITDTLLAMLEPETARAWFDEALMEAVDLSHISWVLTANDISGLPRPLLSRLTVVEAGVPGAEHFERLLSGIRADLAAELDIPPGQLPDLMPEAVDALGKAFENGTDIRTLKRAVTRALAQGGERVVQ